MKMTFEIETSALKKQEYENVKMPSQFCDIESCYPQNSKDELLISLLKKALL